MRRLLFYRISCSRQSNSSVEKNSPIDDVIDGLEALPGAAEYAQHLKAALLQTEEIYCGGENASPPGELRGNP